MGLAIKDLIPSKEIEISDLNHKILAVDTFNLLYQFLTTIRSRDGSLLTDSSGNVTSHLVGLFSRTTNFMDKGIKLAFVFDGKPPKLKQEERERRKSIKLEAEKKYKIAVKKQDLDDMKKYASRTTRLTSDMIEESKKLIKALGFPVIQAPSEGEAQAAYLAKKGDVFASVSQDFDSLLHGCPKLIRNLSVVGRRKATHKLGTITIKPEMIKLSEVLNNLGIDINQLIILAILVGTDYNIGGVKGIGPKNALKLVKEHRKNPDEIFKNLKNLNFDWKEIYDTIAKMPTTDDYDLKWNNINQDKINELLVEQHDFSVERVEKSLKTLVKQKEKRKQKSLGEF